MQPYCVSVHSDVLQEVDRNWSLGLFGKVTADLPNFLSPQKAVYTHDTGFPEPFLALE